MTQAYPLQWPDTDFDAPANRAWWDVLGVGSDATPKEAKAAYKTKCWKAGGATKELNAAKSEGLA